jgi:GDPmannose 4,6-dehydratase
MVNLETVLITGSLGQDARLLVELLSSKKIQFICTSKDKLRSRLLYKDVKAPIFHEHLDITNTDDFAALVQMYRPDKIFNFAGLSSVWKSFSKPLEYQEVNGNSVERILLKLHRDKILGQVRFYQASSSEIFDPSETGARSENSTKTPQSPYGASKLYAFEVCQDFRLEKGYFVCSGILFNHESEYRGEEFLFGNVMNSLARIKYGRQNILRVGNLDAQRDWGYARDYVRAIDLMTSCDTPDDYVVATGKLHRVKEVIALSYKAFNISRPLEDILLVSDDIVRKGDHSNLLGNPEKIYRTLGWEPNYTLEQMVKQIQSIILENYEESNSPDE